MTRGLLDHIEQASHIGAGMDITFGAAMEIVHAAEDSAAEIDTAASITADNVIYGVAFGQTKSKDPTGGTL